MGGLSLNKGKNDLRFAILWIIIYVFGSSCADLLSAKIGMEKLLTLPVHAGMSLCLLVWMRRSRRTAEYGLCKPKCSARRFLYYLPLAALASCNLWYGAAMRMSPQEAALYIASMICVGFLEEIIFRGLLFQAMRRDNLRSAIIVSSLTFGIGHILNLFNGSGMELVAGLCQVCYATAFGFLCVLIFYRSGSLLPCIIVHSAVNALSAFSSPAAETTRSTIISSAILCIGTIAYALVLNQTLPKAEE